MFPLPEPVAVAQVKLLLVFAVPESPIAVVVIVKHPRPELSNISASVQERGRVKVVYRRAHATGFVWSAGGEIIEPGIRNLNLRAGLAFSNTAFRNRQIVFKAFK
jgi:hypothetical protein